MVHEDVWCRKVRKMSEKKRFREIIILPVSTKVVDTACYGSHAPSNHSRLITLPVSCLLTYLRRLSPVSDKLIYT